MNFRELIHMETTLPTGYLCMCVRSALQGLSFSPSPFLYAYSCGTQSYAHTIART